MKYLLILLATLLFAINVWSCKKSSALNPSKITDLSDTIRIANWYDDKTMAFSFGFDDNLSSHYEKIAPILDEFNIQGTFAVITSPESVEGFLAWKDIWTKYQSLSLRGHELANHTYTHNLSNANVNDEISKSLYEFRLKGLPRPISFVQPGNVTTPFIDSAIFANHLICRISSIYSKSNRFFAHFTSKNTFADFRYGYLDCLQKKKWYMIAAHGLDGAGWEPLTSDFLRQMCSTLKNADSLIWIAPMGIVGVYDRIKKETKITTAAKPNQLNIIFENPLFNLYTDTFHLAQVITTLIVPMPQALHFKTIPEIGDVRYNATGKYYILNFNILKIRELQINFD